MIKALKALTKDSMIYGATNFLGKLIGFLLLPLYTTYLTPKDYGVLAMLAFISVFFIPMASAGMTNAIFRRYNLHSEFEQQSGVLSTGSFFVLTTSLLLFLLGGIFIDGITFFLVDSLDYRHLVNISLITSFFLSMASVYTVVLRAQRRVTTIGIVRTLELLLTVGTTIYLVVVAKQGVEGVLWGALVGGVFSAIAQFLLCLKDLSLKVDMRELVALLRYGLPYLPHRMLTYGSAFFGQYFIKNYIGLSASGLYDIALRFAIPLSFLVGSVQLAWVPIKFQIHREEINKTTIFRSIISTYFLLVLLLFLGLITYGPEILRLMTATEYHEAAKLLPFVLLIPLCKSTYFMLSTGFEFTNDTRPAPLISGAGLLVLLLSSVPLIQAYGIYGAIVGVVLSWITMTFLVRYFATKRFYVPVNNGILGILALSSVSLLGIAFMIQRSDIGLGLRLGIESIILLLGVIVIVTILVKSKDFKSLDLERYPAFGRFTQLLAFIKR